MKTLIRLQNRRLITFVPFCLVLLGLAGIAFAAGSGTRFTGRVVYRGNKANAGSLQVEIVEAKDSGEPTDKILGSTRADADGHFIVLQTEETDRPVALVASAVRESADSSGDRRQEGYDIKSHMTRLGFLSHPSPMKPNTVLVDRRQLGHSSDN